MRLGHGLPGAGAVGSGCWSGCHLVGSGRVPGYSSLVVVGRLGWWEGMDTGAVLGVWWWCWLSGAVLLLVEGGAMLTFDEVRVFDSLVDAGRPELAAWWRYRCDPEACWSTFGTMEERGDLVALCPELDPGADMLTVHVMSYGGQVSTWAGCSVCGGQSGTPWYITVGEALARLDSFGLAGWIDHHMRNGHGQCPLFSIKGWS